MKKDYVKPQTQIVEVESNNMDEYGNIIIERGVPVLIKLHIDYWRE